MMEFTLQLPYKYPTTSQQDIELIKFVGNSSVSVKEMMELKDRANFLCSYLKPFIKEGFLRLLYSDKPNHPRQKYLLIVKGLSFYNEINKDFDK